MATVTVSADINQSAVAYAAGDTIAIDSGAILTADTDGLTRPLKIQCTVSGEYSVVNTSTTNPIVITLNGNTGDFIFRKNGIFRLAGDFISLGAAAGTASETFSLASAPLNVIPYPSLVEVETAAGSGLYIPYKVICTAGKTVNIPTTEFCAVGEAGEVIFWNATTQVLTSGDGTNGSLLPAGANVRIPNIYVHSNSNNATPSSRSLIDLNATGKLIAYCVGFSDAIYLATTTFSQVSLTHCGFAGQMSLQSSNATVTIDHVCVSPDTQQTTTAQACIINAINGAVSLNKLRTMTGGLVTGGSKNQILNLFGLTLFSDCSFGRRAGRSATTDEALILQNITQGMTVTNLSWIGGRGEFNNLNGQIFNGTKSADDFGTAQLTGIAVNAVATTNSADLIFNGFGNAGVAACRDRIFGLDIQTSGISVYNANYDGGGNPGGIAENNCTGLSVINSTFLNIQNASILIDNPTTFLQVDFRLLNNRVTCSGSAISIDGGQGFVYDLCPGVPGSINLSLSGASNYAFGNFIDAGTSPTTGAISCGPFGPGTSITLSGDANYDQAGGIELPTDGDIAEIESLFAMHGVTSFINTAPTWNYVETAGTGTDTTTAPTAVTAEFTVKIPGGSYGAYQAISGANLNAALAALSGYDSDVGFYMKVRFTATSTDTARVISQIFFTTDIDNTYQAPDASVILQGPNPTDITTLYRYSDDAVLGVFTGDGAQEISSAAANYLENVYYIRRTFDGFEIMRTRSAPVALLIGSNGTVSLFAGAEVQLAQAPDLTALKAYVETYLDVAVSDIKKLLRADEVHTATTIQKLEEGTATVLLTKNWTGTPLNNFEAID